MEDVEKFIEKIENWIRSHNINYGTTFEKIDEIDSIININYSEVCKITLEECISNMFLLNQYLYHLNRIVAREKSIKEWADDGIWKVINNFPRENYIKSEERYHMAINANDFGKKLHRLKINCLTKIMTCEATIKSVEQSIKIFEIIMKGKMYGHQGTS